MRDTIYLAAPLSAGGLVLTEPASDPNKEVGARQPPAQTTPLSLLERVRAHQPEAWFRLVQLYRPLVLAWCTRAGVNDTDAEDVAQEVFVAAAAALDRFHHDRPGDTFRGWLRAITRNQILLLFRRNKDRTQAAGGSDAWQNLQAVADPLPGPGEETLEVGQLYLRALELVRAEFEERTWQAFWLTVVEDREPAAVAQELNMTPNNIRQARSRVLRRLREEVGDLFG
jgi:RNA polymerase sigma-70 factor (ECF subfamily)